MCDRADVSTRNRRLYDTERLGRRVELTTMLNELCDWKEFPKNLRGVHLQRVRWLYYHGNWKAFIGDDGKNYWLCSWLGS